MLSDPREPLPVQVHTWVGTVPGSGQRLREQCVLLCPQPLCPLTPVSVAQAVFTLLLGPFTFFDVQKTKYLQILTSLMRWIGESEKHLESLPFLSSSPPHPFLRQPGRLTATAGMWCRFSWARGVKEEAGGLPAFLLVRKFSTEKC